MLGSAENIGGLGLVQPYKTLASGAATSIPAPEDDLLSAVKPPLRTGTDSD